MAMYNKFITFLVLTFMVSISFAQQYTPMTAAGYQYKRAKVDSTLHIPSFCGVPTLRNSTAIQGALAMDTCANKLYQWTHAAGWSTISTNAIDSLKRSNDSIFARKSGVWVFQYKDSIGGGGTTPSLQDVATIGNFYYNDYADTLRLNSYDGDIKHPILWNSDFYGGTPNNILDFSYGPNLYENVAKIKFGDNSNLLGHGYIEITDKQSYFTNESSTRTIIQNAPSTYSTYQTTYFPLMKGGTDTLATTEDIRNSAIDTSNKFVNNIYRTSGVDSIYYTIGSNTYAIKDSAGGGSSQNGRFGNDTATIVMAKVHNDAGIILTNGKVVAFSTSGTSSDAPSVKLANNKADSTSATTFGFVSGTIPINDTGWVILSGKIEKLNTSAFANGDIIYLDSISGQWTKSKPQAPYHLVYLGTIIKANAGNGSIFTKVQNGYELDEIHNVQINSVQNNQILVYSDTQKLWKNRSIYSVVDTTNKIATKTNLALKLNISDTATMLTPYLRKTDTASLSSRINLKVNIADTASMLTPYLRSNTASATYLAKSDSTIYYTKYRSDTSRTNIYNALLGKQGTITLTTTGTSGASTLVGNTLNIPQYSGGTSYTFSTGLTNSSGTVTSNLSTGVSGGQSVVGGTAASNSLTLSSTSNATKGKILFGTSAYDEVNNRLGIGTASPTDALQVNLPAIGLNSYFKLNSPSPSFSTYFGTTSTNQYAWFTNIKYNGTAFVKDDNTKSAWRMNQCVETTDGNSNFNIEYWTPASLSNVPRLSIFGNGNVAITGSYVDAGYKLDVNGTARIQGDITSTSAVKATTSSATTQFNLITPVTTNYPRGRIQVGQSSSDGNVGIYFNPLYSTAGAQKPVFFALATNNNVQDATEMTGSFFLSTDIFNCGTAKADGTLSGGVPITFSPAGSEAIRFNTNGNIQFPSTNTASGTTGNQTINKTSGTVNIAAAGTTVTVTNSLVTASSIVYAVIRTNDATATIKNVVPAAGSFVINLNAATTAETSIGFFVIN